MKTVEKTIIVDGQVATIEVKNPNEGKKTRRKASNFTKPKKKRK